MPRHIVIIGAGILGSALAYRLQSAACQVTVLDAGAGSATDASFGWINASFYLSEDHFHFRHAGLAAYTDLAAQLTLPLRQLGCLNWEYTGAEFDAYEAGLQALGYPTERIDQERFSQLEPHIGTPPEQSLLFATEAVAEPSELRAALLAAAQSAGARVIRGVRVTDIENGVYTPAGFIAADEVVVAAGTGAPALLRRLDVSLPMLKRPAYIIETAPLPPMLAHVLAGPHGEVRQKPDGRLIAPTSVAHQADGRSELDQTAEEAAAATLARLQPMFPARDLAWTTATLAHRPVPGDGLPVIGRVAPNVYVTVMHSGLTLAAITANLAAAEILDGPSNTTSSMLAAFRPERFTAR